MLEDNMITNLKEFNYCTSKINKWYKRQSKLLTIVTNPYNTPLIFLNIIEDTLLAGKKILYVHNCDKYNKEIINGLKKNNSIRYSDNYKDSESDIDFIDFKSVKDVRGAYDLCIIDDISCYSNISKEIIREYIETLYLFSKRIIVYSIERIVNMGMAFQISDLIRNEIFVEPRIITTRVRLDEDMPYTLYDYLMWFKSNNRKVIIYVPNEEKIEKLYNYYTKELQIDDVQVIKHLKKNSTIELEDIYKNNNSVFIITNDIREYSIKESNIDIVILFSEDKIYTYKRILYFCADVGKYMKDKKYGEVLLVGREITEDMDIAKEMARGYNKKIWEKGLLNY